MKINEIVTTCLKNNLLTLGACCFLSIAFSQQGWTSKHNKDGSLQYLIHNEQEFNSISQQIKPGDDILIANGTYKPWTLIINSNGTAFKPITIQAETTGKVIFTGDAEKAIFKLTGSYTILRGMYFTACNVLKDSTHA